MNRAALNQVKKLLLVAFLTLLIWAWAYNALEATTTQPATLSIYQAPGSDLLVQFVDRESPIEFEITLKGPASKVAELERKVLTGEEKLDFVFNAKAERKFSAPGRYPIDMLQFIKDSAKMEVLSLTVESVSVESVEVQVEQLVEKQVQVQVLNQNRVPLETEDVRPSTVQVYIRPETPAESVKANVTLTPDQIARARKQFITAEPVVEIAPNEYRQAPNVEIKLPTTEDTLKDKPLAYLPIGFIMGDQIEGKYRVELLNGDEVLGVTNFQATDQAWQAYEDTIYKVVVPVYQNDANQEVVRREVIYNFPQEYVRKGEIKVIGKPRTAEFKLLPVENQSQQQ